MIDRYDVVGLTLEYDPVVRGVYGGRGKAVPYGDSHMTKQKELIREYLAKDKQKNRPAPSKKPKQREI